MKLRFDEWWWSTASTIDSSLNHKVIELETNHNRNYLETQKMIESYGYREEFIAAVKQQR